MITHELYSNLKIKYEILWKYQSSTRLVGESSQAWKNLAKAAQNIDK